MELVREPTNTHDPNAVAVLLGGKLAAYIPRDCARQWSAFVAEHNAAGRRVRARARVWSVRQRGEAPIFRLYLEVPEDPGDYARRAAAKAERAQASMDRAAQREAEAAARIEARAERERANAELAALREQRRAAGVCVDCGAPIERVPGARGRPPIRCAVHAAAEKGHRQAPPGDDDRAAH